MPRRRSTALTSPYAMGIRGFAESTLVATAASAAFAKKGVGRSPAAICAPRRAAATEWQGRRQSARRSGPGAAIPSRRADGQGAVAKRQPPIAGLSSIASSSGRHGPAPPRSVERMAGGHAGVMKVLLPPRPVEQRMAPGVVRRTSLGNAACQPAGPPYSTAAPSRAIPAPITKMG